MSALQRESTDAETSSHVPPFAVLWWATGLLAGVVTFIVLAGRTGEGGSPVGLTALLVLLTELPFVAAWLLAAGGYGWALGRWLLGEAEPDALVRLALGIAALLVIDAVAGRAGALALGGSLGAWGVLAIGWALLANALRAVSRADGGRWSAQLGTLASEHSLAFLAAPAVAVLLLAATSAPGWLWATEFGGYDALSYHLQLPAEWTALGRIVPLAHNVYSFLPGFIEAAFFHLMIMRGDVHEAAYACQLLHATMTVLAAMLTGRLAQRMLGQPHGTIASCIAFVIMLGTPWTIVVGSLAYNEMAVAMLLATALLIARNEALSISMRGTAVGLLTAAACGAKLTAAGFVAAPLTVVLLWSIPARQWWRAAMPGAAAGTIALGPWLIGNALASGNPVFPFATELLGTAHWSSEQAATWSAAHSPPDGADERLTQLWHQFLRFGIGANPDAAEPWKPQWSILPWLMLSGAVLGLMRAELRRVTLQLAVIALLQLAFWLLLTHMKSRFILPAVVPAAVLVAMPIGWVVSILEARRPRRTILAGLGAASLVWSLQPAVIYWAEAGGAPAARVGLSQAVAGKGLSRAERDELARMSPAIWINTQLASDALVLMVGEAAPYYYAGDRVRYQTTWDRGPLSRAMRRSDDPRDWIDALHREGFTHLLVNPVMLGIWERDGWNDPQITTGRVIDAAQAHALRVAAWPSGERLYRLPPSRP